MDELQRLWQEIESDSMGLIKSAREHLYDDALAYLEDIRATIEKARAVDKEQAEE